MEEYSQKAQWGQISYFVLLNLTLGSVGRYTCVYQHRNKKNWVRSSALRAPWHLVVRGETQHGDVGRRDRAFATTWLC